MFEIGKTFRFEAAHQLLHHDGKCARPHGHSYEFELIVERSELRVDGPAAGMVDDYDSLSQVGNWIADQLDHRDLNVVLDSDTTTAEELSRVIWDLARPQLPGLVEIRTRETAKTYASFRPRRAAEKRVQQVGQWMIDDVRERLYAGVDTSDPNACWPFTGSLDIGGYGWCSFAFAGTKKAHRLAAWLAGDDIDDRVVLHSCDNPPCINWRHLYTGSHAENEADKDAKGRRPIGEDHGAAKLTEEHVRTIVQRVRAGEARRDVAASFGVSTALVAAIMCGRVWRHVTGFGRP